MFLKLDGRRCLVVGAGAIARPKIESLLRADASVVVVAPEALPQIVEWAKDERLEWHAREFAPEDLDSAFLVIAATNRKEVNHAVAEAARARGVLCNSVDDPPDCDFYYPSVVERGDLQIAISTNGQSPSLAQKLRQQLERQFGPGYAEWVKQLGDTRRLILASDLDQERKLELLHSLASREALEAALAKVPVLSAEGDRV